MSGEKTDVMVLGATGFTGRLVARYLISHPDFLSGAFTFSLAGRSVSKIKALQHELGIDPDRVRIVEVDVLDDASVVTAIKTTRVVIDVVGPYWRWGKLVVRACAAEGVHYVDLTGEPPYMKWIVDECDALAKQTGAILIPNSGQDSIPSDVSVYLSNKALKEYSLDSTIEDSITSFELHGGISGGTYDTFFTILTEVSPDCRRESMKPFSISPINGVPQPGIRRSYSLPLYPHITGGFFPMMVIDRLVVQRTWGLHQRELASAQEDSSVKARSYGPKFRYTEFVVIPGGKLGGLLFSIFIFIIGMGMTYSPLRWLFKRLVAQPGSGPSESVMQNGSIVATNVSTSGRDAVTGKPTYVRSVFRGRGDPGYFLTSLMIAESALAIALEKEALPPLAHQGGALTPMSALGDVLLRRLEHTGRFKFESGVVDENGKPL